MSKASEADRPTVHLRRFDSIPIKARAARSGVERCGARDERNDEDERVLKRIWEEGPKGKEGGRKDIRQEGRQDIGKR